MEKIALFGTSADPPTVGHQIILSWLAQHYDRVVVWASDNPFKQHQTPLSDRTQMLQLAIKDLEAHHHNISLHPELSDRYTLVSVDRAKKKWEQGEFNLVIGSDILPQITSWYRIEELLQQVRLLIIPRKGYEITQPDLASLSKIGEFAIATLNAPQVSSSTYRSQKDSYLIVPAVEDYIQQNNLYNSSIDTDRSRQSI